MYDNLEEDEELATRVHETILFYAHDGFRDMDGIGMRKMKALRKAVESTLRDSDQGDKIDDIMQLIVANKEY